ncbi:MCE family protein [Mucilaginibacter sp. Bleaf8]|uniref:MlaD family protein n=1 Tax=Mucilaginibacter sp. Bleaf8 TaxID=2834430 RepID=UPI001BCBA56A|nr:MlaD family protein [Mucilaginibacter sp. Bleaf8]MBS7565793.1 MCE family protein [Mucilaginibacter sp. Bleaf8]
MKTTSSQKIKIGLFVVAGLVVVFLGIFLIGSQKSLFNSTFNVYGVFKNVNGLMVGNNVRFAGINVGVVEGINIVSDSTVRVDLTLNDNVRKFVKKDAKMSIGSDGLMGDKLVVISPGGSSSNQIVESGEKLTVVNPLDVDKIINKLTKVADNAESLTSNLTDIVRDINQGKGSLGKLLRNDKIARDLATTVSSAKTTIRNANRTTVTLNEDLKAAQHNFLLRGFFKKKEKEKQRKIDSARKAQEKLEKAKKKQED